MVITMKNMRIYAEINLTNIKKNAEAVRKIVGDDVDIMAVVKADGYGHGAKKCVDATNDIVDKYAVATFEEAIELREYGVTKEILILGYTFPDYYEKVILNNISLTVFDYNDALRLSKCAVNLGRIANIHIAIDTGMGRIGFIPNDKSVEQILNISKLPMLKIDGVFSHFATSDEKDKEYSYMQINKFNRFCELLEEKGIVINIKHIENSAAITELSGAAFDMVRMGIILYGLYPSNEVERQKIKLFPAMELKTTVVHVKTISKGDCVSYGRHFVADKETKVATISAGYADGYPRLLSDRGRVIINGKYAPIIGAICMDQFMVDVSEIDDVKVGDEVILMGEINGISVTADEIADLIGTINYEIICGISKRVPRIYVV